MKVSWPHTDEYARMYEDAEWSALSADLAQMPDKPISRVGTGKEQWIGNPQDAELGRLQSAESAEQLAGPRSLFAAGIVLLVFWGFVFWLLGAWAKVTRYF